MDAELPIFPLRTVLFPGGTLALRVFEARYVDMVRDCMKRQSPFGVCLITRGGEVGETAAHEPVGCLASIADWDMEQLGLLQIRARGGERFRVLSRRIRKDGLILAQTEPIEADEHLPVPEAYSGCLDLLRRIVDDLTQKEPDPLKRVIGEPYDYACAAWVGNRLSEFLPIPAQTKQKLMELPDPIARLALVQQYLRQQRVI